MEAHVAEQIDGLAFSNGAHVAEIELDPDTGNVKVLNYTIAHDCGVIVNPLVIDGQVAGGAAHGLGFAMYEKMIWDDQAQPQSTNLAEYLIPGSAEMPNVHIEHIVVPSSQNAGCEGRRRKWSCAGSCGDSVGYRKCTVGGR